MSRRARWIVVALVLAAVVAVVVAGGFLWPRPQFRRGPWAAPDTAPATPPPASSAPAAPSAPGR